MPSITGNSSTSSTPVSAPPPAPAEMYRGFRIEARERDGGLRYEVYWPGYLAWAEGWQTAHPEFTWPYNAGVTDGRLAQRTSAERARQSIDFWGGEEGLLALLATRPDCDCPRDVVRLLWNNLDVSACESCRAGDHSSCHCYWHECAGCGCVCEQGNCPGCGCMNEEVHGSVPWACGADSCRRCNPPLEYRAFSTRNIRGDTDKATYLVKPRRVGMEFEFETAGGSPNTRLLMANLPTTIGINGDGSLRGFPAGGEYTTPPGFGVEMEELVRTTLAALGESGYTATQRAGLHVHVEAMDLDPIEQWRAYATIRATQDVIHRVIAQHRVNGFNHDLQIEFEQAMRTIEGADVAVRRGALAGPRQDRYVIANFGTEYSTVEFRAHESTLDADAVLSWAALCQAYIQHGVKGWTAASVRELAAMPIGMPKFERLAEVIDLGSNAYDRLHDKFQSRSRTAAARRAAA